MEPIIIIFLSAVGCEVDFDDDYWAQFKEAMMQEWDVQIEAYCVDVKQYPKALWQYQMLRAELGYVDNTVIFLTEKNSLFADNGLGVAYQKLNIGFVNNKLVHASITVSHELLHLWLDQIGMPGECSVAGVHAHQYQENLVEYGQVKIIEHFEC